MQQGFPTTGISTTSLCLISNKDLQQGYPPQVFISVQGLPQQGYPQGNITIQGLPQQGYPQGKLQFQGGFPHQHIRKQGGFQQQGFQQQGFQQQGFQQQGFQQGGFQQQGFQQQQGGFPRLYFSSKWRCYLSISYEIPNKERLVSILVHIFQHQRC